MPLKKKSKTFSPDSKEKAAKEEDDYDHQQKVAAEKVIHLARMVNK